MNINNVYECLVLRIVKRTHDTENDRIHYTFNFFKKALVYKYDTFHWIDLNTKELYLNDTSLVFGFEEELYVPSNRLIPISALVDFKRVHMTKKGISKEYNKQRVKSLRKSLRYYR